MKQNTGRPVPSRSGTAETSRLTNTSRSHVSTCAAISAEIRSSAGRARREAAGNAALAPLGDLRVVAFHDAYQYLENRFGVTAAGSVSLSDASTPSPARIAELRAAVGAMGVTCALSEPQFDPDLLGTVFEGSGVTTAVIDPLGAAIPPGPQFYPALIRSFGTALAACRPGG